MLRVALTGGIASGKTAVSDAFAKLGVPIIDADVASRAVVEPDSEGLQQLVKRFGEDILTADGALERCVALSLTTTKLEPIPIRFCTR